MKSSLLMIQELHSSESQLNTIIMLFAFPIGIIMLLSERKSRQKYQAVFDDFQKKVESDKHQNPKEKITLFEEMLHQNRYHITGKSEQEVIGEKKIFSMGYLFIGIGTLYIGLIVYILYYLYFQKPHIVRFYVSQ